MSSKTLHVRLSEKWAVLVCGLSGALDVVPAEVSESLQAGGHAVDWFPPKLTEYLTNRGYLLSSHDEERQLLASFYQASVAHWRDRLQVNFCPTFQCNLACTYCFEQQLFDRAAPGPHRMTTEQVAQGFALVDRLMADQAAGHFSLGLFGGEPLQMMTLPIVDQIIQGAAERSLRLHITTNGVDLKPFYDLLTRHRNTLRFKVTLDGPANVHDGRRRFKNGQGSFQQIAENVTFLLEANIPTEIGVNLDSDNLHALREFFSQIDEIGWPLYPNFSCALYRVHDRSTTPIAQGLPEDEILHFVETEFASGSTLPSWLRVSFLNVLRHLAYVFTPDMHGLFTHPMVHFCEASAGSSLFLGPDNLVYPCSSVVGQSDLAIGQYHPSISWNAEMRDQWNRSIESVAACRECDVSLLCGGGCAVRALRESGDIQAPDCNEARQMMQRYLESHRDTLLAFAGEV